MSHYDCDDCGAYLGLRYGTCPECTPKEVLDLDKELDRKFKEAKNEFNTQHKAEYDRLMHWYINEQCSEIRTKYKEAFEKHNPRRKK